MKNKKIGIILGAVLVLIAGFVIYFIGFKQDKDTTLTLLEKQWIEANKSKLIDLSIISNVPIITYNGEGIFFDFLDDLEDNTKLEFNKLAYTGDQIKSEYTLKIVDSISDNQIKIFEDNYVVVSTIDNKITSLDDFNNITVGVLDNDLEQVNKYLNINSNMLLKTYSDYEAMISEISNDEKKVDAIVLPRLTYFQQIVSNEKLSIVYHISEIKKYYVLQLGTIDRLNDILIKYYNKWSKNSYSESYANQFLNCYLSFSNIDDKKKADFKSKRYLYGFYKNNPYDDIIDAKYVGINHALIANFSEFAGIELNYKKYNDINSLVKDFNENKLDVIFNNTTYTTFDMDVINTISSYDEKIVILANPINNITINSINSLHDKEVLAVEETKIADLLLKKGIKVTLYENINDLMSKINKDSIIVIDFDAYNSLASKQLANYKIMNVFNLNSDYNFTVRKTSENELFAQVLNFYLMFNDEEQIVNNGYYEIMTLNNRPFSVRKVVLISIGIISILGLTLLGIKILQPKKKKIKKVSLTKEDKLKYIDMLTSLKNRNYLNANIERWDASEVYPQAIIIIDLNNVAYINDNYGHSEGDKVIGEAANILIATQVPNSDIIRTNGNEFLIYMVSYDEKQIVSYIRKLNKEFKGLSHGFGAAIGYSMIKDAIKTVDDAINEATAVMREIKEEIDY